MKVIGNRVYLRPKSERQTGEGIILELDTSLNAKPINKGYAVYVGEVDGVQEGDLVMFDHIQARKVNILGEELYMLHESALYAIVIEN